MDRTRPRTKNRAVLDAATDEGATTDGRPGLVAYDDGAVVGWVSVGPREDYERLAFSKVLAPLDDTPGLVDRVLRRRSPIARRWASPARCWTRRDRLRPRPRGDDAGGLPDRDRRTALAMPSANVYHGTLSMFERAGFEVAERRQFSAASPRPTDRPARPLNRCGEPAPARDASYARRRSIRRARPTSKGRFPANRRQRSLGGHLSRIEVAAPPKAPVAGIWRAVARDGAVEDRGATGPRHPGEQLHGQGPPKPSTSSVAGRPSSSVQG